MNYLEYAIEVCGSAILALLENPLRSSLTSLGMIVAVGSVIAVVSLIEGLTHSIESEFKNLGANQLTIAPNSVNFAKSGKTKKNFGVREIQAVTRVHGVDAVVPIYLSKNIIPTVRFRGSQTNTRLIGTTHGYSNISNSFVASGRFFNLDDKRRKRRVSVIGDDVYNSLTLVDPIGKHIEIADEWFKIVGVLERKGSFLGVNQDNVVLIPDSTFQVLNGNDESNLELIIQVVVADGSVNESLSESIERRLRLVRDIGEHEESDFEIQSSDQVAGIFGNIVGIVTSVLVGIISISMIVGGIGIMNTMLASVAERTREVGLAKALGATRLDILMQYLTESIILCLFGGCVGIILGYALGWVVAFSVPGLPQPIIPLWGVLLAVTFSTISGIAFGVLPAARAADLNPIDALNTG